MNIKAALLAATLATPALASTWTTWTGKSVKYDGVNQEAMRVIANAMDLSGAVIESGEVPGELRGPLMAVLHVSSGDGKFAPVVFSVGTLTQDALILPGGKPMKLSYAFVADDARVGNRRDWIVSMSFEGGWTAIVSPLPKDSKDGRFFLELSNPAAGTTSLVVR